MSREVVAGDVGEGRAAGALAHGSEAGRGGLEPIVDLHVAARVETDTGDIEADPRMSGVGPTATSRTLGSITRCLATTSSGSATPTRTSPRRRCAVGRRRARSSRVRAGRAVSGAISPTATVCPARAVGMTIAFATVPAPNDGSVQGAIPGGATPRVVPSGQWTAHTADPAGRCPKRGREPGWSPRRAARRASWRTIVQWSTKVRAR